MAKDWLRPENVARIAARDGLPHSVAALDPADTALLVVDVQNFYLLEGQPAYSPLARGVVPNVNRLAAAARAVGVPVIWLRNVMDDEAFESWSVHYGRMRPEKRAARARELDASGEGFRLWHALDAEGNDLYIDKTRYSAFIPGASGIAPVLAERGIRTLVMCGVSTNICVESTARDAMMLNYRVLVAADACAANSEAEHAASLNVLYTAFGDVQSTDAVVALLETAGRQRVAAAE